MSDEMESIKDIIERGFTPTGVRHPVVRRGERALISPQVRSAVWYRDHGACELCGTKEPVSGQPWHIDHITPWSAGGSDDSTNLRVLCEAHNMQRGNAVDVTERPRRAVTWWCSNCYTPEAITFRIENEPWSPGYDWGADGALRMCPFHWTDYCRIIKGFTRLKELTGTVTDWHRRPLMADAHTIAYCAHCNAPGLTEWPL